MKQLFIYLFFYSMIGTFQYGNNCMQFDIDKKRVINLWTTCRYYVSKHGTY